MIAVDVMGGDHAPYAVMGGALAASRAGIPVLLCGPKDIITAALPRDWDTLPISFEFCEQRIEMGEEPGRAVRKKPQSSLVYAMRAVAQGRAAAFFSAGNSGAVLVASVILSGRIKGIHRPAVGVFLPTAAGDVFCLDVGGNVDCKPEYLQQFALMGHAYVGLISHKSNPRIALLSNGHEPYKGSHVVKEAYKWLVQSNLHFVGNIESREIGNGSVDVVVCDGFVGNVLLKAIQGTAHTFFSWVKADTDRSWMRKIALWLNRGLFKRMKQQFDYAATGGALLLGVNHPVILAHGRSDEHAVKNGIIFAHRVVQENRVALFRDRVLELLHDSHTFTGAIKQKVRSFLHWRHQ